MASSNKRAAGDDPFANLNIDQSWAASAAPRELSAKEREWAAKQARWRAEDQTRATQDRQARRHQARVERRARRTTTYAWLAFAVVAALLIVGSRLFDLPGATTMWATDDRPPAGVGEQDGRVLPAVTAPTESSDFVAGVLNDDGFPATFSPCRAWPVVVNTAHAPPNGYAAVSEAVQEVSARTGLQLIVEGATDEQVESDRNPYQPDRYGKRWAPILVTWTTGNAENGFAGHGGPVVITLPDGQKHLVGGQVTLDSAGAFNLDSGQLRAVLLHELGHVVGLQHAAGSSELMAPVGSGLSEFGPGDLAGLALLGSGACSSKV